MKFRSVCFVAVLVGSVTVPLWSGASAKDLEVLTRLLIPAYTAQDFAALCVSQDPQFLSDLKYGAGSVGVYAQHVKKEVTIDIPEDEAARVRIIAADIAREIARQELHLLIEQQTANLAISLRNWCDRAAKPFILEIVSKHQEKHLEFDKIVEDAKR